jgi:Transposase DDE domain
MIDKLLQGLRAEFNKIADHRRSNCSYKLVDVLMAGFAIFHLKNPSLLAFREHISHRIENIKTVYGFDATKNIPGDTAFRKCLDYVTPSLLIPVFAYLIDHGREKGCLKDKEVLVQLGGYTLVSIDGTGYFHSAKTSCQHCLIKNHRNGEISYHHQMLAAAIVNPNHATVIPVYGEPIVRQDGAQKNDCERNAFKRLVPTVRQLLPNERVIVLLDGLYADGPTIRACHEQNMNFITTIKDGYVLIQSQRLREQGGLDKFSWQKKNITCTIEYTCSLHLNGQNRDTLVNYILYQEFDNQTDAIIYKCQWITDIMLNDLDQQTIKDIVTVARSRWKIENETFNTLKNQEYHLEHSFGHGEQYLSSVFALLMLLAFSCDQLAQCIDPVVQKGMAKYKTKKAFFYRVQIIFDLIPTMSMNAIYRLVAGDLQINLPQLE